MHDETIRLRRWRTALFVVFALSGLSVSTWSSRVPAVQQSLHVSTAIVGDIVLAMSIGAVLGLIAAPIIAHRLGVRRGIVATLWLTALGLAIIGVGTSALASLPVVLGGMALLGFGNGSVDVIMNVSAADVERRLGRTTMPMMHAMFSIGTVIGAAVGAGAAALDIAVGWHDLLMTLVVAAVVVVAVRFVPDLSDEHTAVTGADGEASAPRRLTLGDRLRVWQDATLVFIGVVMLGMAFAEGSANDWIALASVDGHHRTPAEGAAILDVFVIAMTIGRMLGGFVVDRIGRVLAIRITAACGIVGLLLFINADAAPLYIVGAALWGLGASLGFPLGMSAAADDAKNATVRVSTVAIAGYCAFLVGPPLIGWLASSWGILHALYVIVALLVAALLASGAVRERTYP